MTTDSESLPCSQLPCTSFTVANRSWGVASADSCHGSQVLVAGVILITLNGSSPGAGGPNSGTREDYDLVVGLGASAASGLSSAYAGVYFEK